MDKRAAAQYMTTLFGDGQGYVAVAYKDKGESWQEHTFQWPKEKGKVVAWAAVHADANVFICPALRTTPTREKGNGTALRWLWADVDWDTVPVDRRADVEARINELGGYVVSSGSGDNRHVYVKLEREVSVGEHLRLNTGLRDYLYADNKQADNSLLRLSGTTNWKTDEGRPVKTVHNVINEVTPEALLEKRVFSSARVIGEVASDFSWEFKELEGLPKRIMRLARMPVEQAEAKYGNRHKAVWAVAGELHKRGLDGDEVHTLMDDFPAALSKAQDENGYDVHKDVEKRLIWDRAQVSTSDDAEDQADAEEEGFELADDADDLEDFKREVEQLAQLDYKRSMARKRAREMEAEQSWVVPPPDITWTLTDGLSNPPRPIPYLIEGLAGAKHNVVIAAQYKTGKTQFVIGSIASALADGTPFLGQYGVHVPEQGIKVGHWNCEMDPAELMDDYTRKVEIQNTDNLVVANLRGYSINLMSAMGKQWAIDWLKSNHVKVWTIDSFARLARMAAVNENDNNEVMSLLMAIDEIKLEAGVDVCFIIAHTGRAKQDEGDERARAATAIDDWPDARWIMVKVDDTRLLRVEGRGVALPETALAYDKETGRSTVGFGGRHDVKTDGAMQTIVRVVKDQPGLTQAELKTQLKGVMGARLVTEHVQEAIDSGFIEIKMDRSGRGNPAKRHYLTGDAPPDNDRHRRATPQEVDLRGVGRPRRRQRA